MSFSEVHHQHHGFYEEDGLENQESDECGGGGGSAAGEKKKRLKREQVRELERSFELGNKLDSERKQQLAKSLCLQPRQVAIWFQNRRARWKTKQLEKDYGLLKKQFACAMADNDKLESQNKQLHHELKALRRQDLMLDGTTNIKKEMAGNRKSWSYNASDNSCEFNLFDSTGTLTSMDLFPSFNRPPTVSHMLESSLRSDPQPSRINQVNSDNESLCNILCREDDQPTGLWPWAEQHQFGQ